MPIDSSCLFTFIRTLYTFQNTVIADLDIAFGRLLDLCRLMERSLEYS